MALEDIIEQIKKENQKKIDEINEEYDKKMKKLDKEFEDMKQEAKAATDNQVATNSKKIMNKMTTVAKMEAKNKLLQEKRELMDEIFEGALNSLAESDDYKKLVKDLLVHSKIDGDDVKVVPAKGKEAETKEALSDSGKDYEMADKSADIKAGFILVSGKVEVDNSFESILNKQLKDEIELEIAKTLF